MGNVQSNTTIIPPGGLGVTVDGKDSIFTMTGGVIAKNKVVQNNTKYIGGAVTVTGDATFNMTGGAIGGSDENANKGIPVGGVYVYKGTFNMSGNAVIGKNPTSGSTGGGVYVANGSTFNMRENALITENDSSGQTGAVTLNGSANTGGVDNSATFNMEGGTITESTGSHTGAVFLGSNGNNTFNMTGGIIFKNHATSTHASNNLGGAVFFGDANANSPNRFTMTGGTISENDSVAGPGGIRLGGYGIFEMSGGIISNNSGKNTGGVYVVSNNGSATFTMTGGVIYGSDDPDFANTSTNGGATLYKNTQSTATIDGEPQDTTSKTLRAYSSSTGTQE
jgi:hypothetical protein